MKSRMMLLRTITRTLTRNVNNLPIKSRYLCTSQPSQPALKKKEVEVTFIRANGERINAKAKVGDTLLDVVTNNNIYIESFGACEGTLTCSTCHLIFKKEDFDRIPNKITDEEDDMLNLAYDVTDTSRLGCQVHLTEELDGLEIRIPETINDARMD